MANARLALGAEAVRANWRPFVGIQLAAAAIVVGYYALSGFRAFAEQLAQVKAAGGIAFSAGATAFAGAVLPEAARRLFGLDRRPIRGADLAFQLAFFAFLGLVVDLFYRALAGIVGGDASVRTVALKILIDQGPFSVLVAIPFSTLAFLWRDRGFDFRRTAASLREGEFSRRYFPLLVTCWAYWGPCLVAIYSLPSRLQIPLYLPVQAAWSLLLLHMTSTPEPAGNLESTAIAPAAVQ